MYKLIFVKNKYLIDIRIKKAIVGYIWIEKQKVILFLKLKKKKKIKRKLL
jgi:phenolic acid decarboxylase